MKCRRSLWLRLAIPAGLYLVYLMMGGCADLFILFPSRQDEDAGSATRHDIPFAGGKIQVLRARSPCAKALEPEAFVLAFLGNADRAEWRATPLAMEWDRYPVEIWAVNYPGYGQSTGPARMSRFPAAGLAAYDALKKEAGRRPVFLSGESLGTTLALHVAANRPASGLVMRSPVPLRSLILRRFGWWNLWLLAGPVALGVPAEMDTLRSAAKVRVPAVFLLTETDAVVPTPYQRMVVEKYAGPKRVVERAAANHNAELTEQARRQLRDGIDWLWQAAAR